MNGCNTKNYFAHGGNELVIGGRLTFLPGAEVDGLEGLFDAHPGEAVTPPYVADSDASTVAALRADYNVLLAALRTIGVLATTAPAEESAENGEVSAGDPDS